MGVCTKERKGVTAAVLMAAPCTNSLGSESGGQKHEGCGDVGESKFPQTMFRNQLPANSVLVVLFGGEGLKDLSAQRIADVSCNSAVRAGRGPRVLRGRNCGQ